MSAITKYFVGGELEALYQGSASGITWATDGGTYDSNFSRGSVKLNGNNSNFINMPLVNPQLDCWVSFQGYTTSSITNSPVGTIFFSFVNANLTPIYQVVCIGGTNIQPIIQLQYWNGSTWNSATGTSTSIISPTSELHKWDFHFKSDASSGILAAYMDGIPFANLTGNTIFTSPSALAAIYHRPFWNFGTTANVYVSEGMVFDVSTLGRRLYTLGETANGTNSQWTGDVTDINEVGTFNDANFIQTGTVNQTSTFVTSTIASAAAQQYLVSGLIVAGRILIGAVGPQNLKGAVVVGGTTYDSTNNVANLLTSFGYTWADFPVNPNTGLDWTVNQINAGIETGWESLT